METLPRYIKKYPVSLLCIATVWILSFFTPPKTGLENVRFIDKWAHVIMYAGTCGMIWIEYLRSHKDMISKAGLAVWAWLMPIVMSGAIELLQEHCTGGRRSGDWIDIAANATGVALAAMVGAFIIMYRARRQTGSGTGGSCKTYGRR